MAITSITAALTQAAANAVWFGDSTKAELRYEALVYLRDNRANTQMDGAALNFMSMESELTQLFDYLKNNSASAIANRRMFTRATARYV